MSGERNTLNSEFKLPTRSAPKRRRVSKKHHNRIWSVDRGSIEGGCQAARWTDMSVMNRNNLLRFQSPAPRKKCCGLSLTCLCGHHIPKRSSCCNRIKRITGHEDELCIFGVGVNSG